MPLPVPICAHGHAGVCASLVWAPLRVPVCAQPARACGFFGTDTLPPSAQTNSRSPLLLLLLLLQAQSPEQQEPGAFLPSLPLPSASPPVRGALLAGGRRHSWAGDPELKDASRELPGAEILHTWTSPGAPAQKGPPLVSPHSTETQNNRHSPTRHTAFMLALQALNNE